jgi:hypothetical protein
MSKGAGTAPQRGIRWYSFSGVVLVYWLDAAEDHKADSLYIAASATVVVLGLGVRARFLARRSS